MASRFHAPVPGLNPPSSGPLQLRLRRPKRPVLSGLAASVAAACLLMPAGLRAQSPAQAPAQVPTASSLSAVPALAAAASRAGAAIDGGAAPAATAMDAELAQLRTQLRQQQDLVQVLRLRLADAEAASAWLPWTVLTGVGALALAGWLGLRLARLTGRPRRPLRSAAAGDPVAADEAMRQAQATAGRADAVTPLSAQGGVGQTLARGAAARGAAADAGATGRGTTLGTLGAMGSLLSPSAAPASPPSTLAGAMEASPPGGANERSGRPGQRSEASDRGERSQRSAAPRFGLSRNEPPPSFAELTMAGLPPRAVSVEELLDLEQQVDFFMVLGQEEAAVDLLVDHIRNTGGTSALPYLKLLEVYKQQGNTEGYERTRSRFNQRFNAYAPEWSADLEAGQSLEAYDEVLQRLSQVWADPIDAMAELEVLLFRRDQGELFDLPAYRDLMLLYALVRDLHDQTPASAVPVDVLLPLDADAGDTTSPRPRVVSHAASRADADDMTEAWARPATVPGVMSTATSRAAAGASLGLDLGNSVDLDLSEPAAAPRNYTEPSGFAPLPLPSPHLEDYELPPSSRF